MIDISDASDLVQVTIALAALGTGGYTGGIAAARARMRLEDRRRLYDVHLVHMLPSASASPEIRQRHTAGLRQLLQQKTGGNNEFTYVIDDLSIAHHFKQASRVAELLSWAERQLWREVETSFEQAFQASLVRIEHAENLLLYERLPTPEDFDLDLTFYRAAHGRPGQQDPSDLGAAYESLNTFLRASLNPRFSNLWLRRTFRLRALVRLARRSTTSSH